MNPAGKFELPVLHSRISELSKGFTLIELIIVMAIVGVLASTFITTYPASQKKARDAKRRSDIKQYQTALESFANKTSGLYPSQSSGSGVPANTTLCSNIGYTANECPDDPKDGQTKCTAAVCRYFYQTENCAGGPGTSCATRYVIWGALEQPKDPLRKFFAVCSNGNVGDAASAPSNGNCPV